MPSRAFSIEDGNLATASVTVARKKTYKDIDLSFSKRVDGDIFKKTDAAAVKQSVKNILLTNFAEKPFLPNFGGNLNSFLFNLSTDMDEDLIELTVVEAIETYEPRARVQNVSVQVKPDRNEVLAKVVFQVITTNDIITLDLDLTRLR